MKPKTELQKEIVRLSKTMRPISDHKKKWAEENCFDNYFVKAFKSHYCLECGEKYKPKESDFATSIIGDKCPSCNNSLKKLDSYSAPSEQINIYWSYITVCKGYQVVRVVFSQKYLRKKHWATYTHDEVMQHWIDKKGNMISLSKTCTHFSGYYDLWTTKSDLEIRTESHSQILRVGIEPNFIYPRSFTLPNIRKNGFTGLYFDKCPHYVFRALLKYPKAETLLKANQIALFRQYLSFDTNKEPIEKHWRSICIAIRHGYQVPSAQTWVDYIEMLEDKGKDIRNPKYICPRDLKKEHDRMVEKINRERKRKKLYELRKELAKANKIYVKHKKPYFDLCFSSGDLEISTHKSVTDIMNESDDLKHCAFANKYHKKADSLLFSAKINGVAIETVEVHLRYMKIVQARGLKNKPTEHHDRIVTLVKQNLHRIEEAKRSASSKKKYKKAV